MDSNPYGCVCVGRWEANCLPPARVTGSPTHLPPPSPAVFTSSAAAVMPSPFAVGYGTTKAALTEFATSLAVEGRAKGIDVCVFHPSPVNSRFLQVWGAWGGGLPETLVGSNPPPHHPFPYC